MATGASNADLAVLLVDARKGVLTQTRRHSLSARCSASATSCSRSTRSISSTSIRGVFDEIATDYRGIRRRARLRIARHDPALGAPRRQRHRARASARRGIEGPSLLEHLETIDVDATTPPSQQLRFPVQWVNRPNQEFRGFSGTVASGEVAPGDPIGRSGSSARVPRQGDRHASTATSPRPSAGDAVTLTLDDEIDVSRGDVLALRDRRRIRRPVRRASRLDEGRRRWFRAAPTG